MINSNILLQASGIKLLALDVDGVLTDGKIWLAPDGSEWKSFHVQDGQGIKILQSMGISIALITARKSDVVARRVKELNIEHYYFGEENKLVAFEKLMALLKISNQEVAYVGDDVIDLPILRQVGFAVAVANAVPEVKQQVHWITEREGGHGAVREVCDLIFKANRHE